MKRIGILTAGGDCPGLNAVIRAVVKSGLRHDPPLEVIGILDGYAGLVEGRSRRLGGISHRLAQAVESRTGDEARVAILGHLQRGGTPTAYDRWLATQFGVKAAELAAGRQWGQMVCLRGTRIEFLPIEQAVSAPRRVDPDGDEVRAARAVGTSFGD